MQSAYTPKSLASVYHCNSAVLTIRLRHDEASAHKPDIAEALQARLQPVLLLKKWSQCQRAAFGEDHMKGQCI